MATNPIPFSPQPRSPFNPPPAAPSLGEEMEANWQLSVTDQAVGRFNELMQPAEPGFNPWDHLSGYEGYAELLVKARSRSELNLMKSRLDTNQKARDILGRGEWGWMAGLASGLGDPLSLVPIPGSSGMGFLKGAMRAGAGNAALTAATEPLRIALDPDAQWNEMAYSVGSAALFGAALGGIVGGVSLSRQRFEEGQAAMRRFDASLSETEAQNIARAFDAREEGYAVSFGNTRLVEDGIYVPVRVETVDVPVRSKQASDGQMYTYDDQMGWLLEADRGIPSPRPVAQDILDELGVPERTTENRMVVDEAALKADYEQGKHLESRGGREPLRPDDVRTAKEYVTFRQIEAVLRRQSPMQPAEDRVAYANRMQSEALQELKDSRASASVARSGPGGFMAPLLDKLNFSPVAKAVRLFKGDNVLGDLPLQIAGDYGWAIRANEFGYKTPPSLLLRAMRHTVAFNEIRQAIDTAWLKYVQQNTKATGMSFMGQNITASAEAMKVRLKNMVGGKALTKEQFSRMAGRAVFDTGNFKIDDFEVVPEAREAAKVWTRVAQRYDAEARELGIFYDQRSLQKTMRTAEERQLRLRRQMAAWLWGGQQGPSRLRPAVKVGDRIFSGESHEEAVMAAMDELGAETQITPDMYGYVPNLASANASDMIGPISGRDPFEWLDATGGKDPAVPKFTVQSKTGAGTFSIFEYGNAQQYFDSVPEHLRDKRVIDEQSFIKFRRQDVRSFFDRSLWPLADDLLNDGVTLVAQENRNGYNGIVYWDPVSRQNLFLSAQAHAFLKQIPGDRLTIIQQTLDRIFPQRADPRHDATLTTELSARTTSQSVLDMYGVTAEQWAARYDQGYRTFGRMSPFVVRDSLTGRYSIMPLIRVAANAFYDSDPLNTAWHEAFHGLVRSGRLAKEEWDVLVAEAKKRKWHEAFADGNRLDDEEALATAIGNWARNPNDPRFADLPPETKTFFERIVSFFRELGQKLFGGNDKASLTFRDIMARIDSGEVGSRPARQYNTFDEAYADAGKPGMEVRGPRFRTLDEVIDERVNSMSERQRQVYDDFRRDLDEVTESYNQAKSQLDQMKAEPHRFTDQFGEPEPYFARYWNHTAISAERDRFRKLLTKWYERDNPVGAAERAEKTIDDMLKVDADDEQPAQVPGIRHLMKRKLDMPNSWRVSDPEMGEIAAADFFNTDLEVVAEAYTRGMGHKIEAARMFGDADLYAKRLEIRQHFRDQYLIPAEERGQDLRPLLEKRDEYMGWIDIIKRGVLGGLKTSDPWSLTSRVARNLKNYQVLTSMGRVLLTSIPEAMRVPMVNGFATAHRGLWLRLFSDWDKIKDNVEFSKQSGELFDLVRDVHAARVAELNQPDPSGGGTWWEKRLESLVPGFLKLVGQTHWTVMAKDLTMFTAQHKVMDLAQRVDEGDNAVKLAAIGISKRDAKLLASMPVDMHGSIILPAVGQWAGADGRRARTLLLDAIHAEARRAIVTPSFADKSLLFQGIVARKGKVVFENDLMTLPLQFISYGLAASQKVMLSGLQGRDQNMWMGALGMFVLAVGSNYLKQPQTATMNKSPEEWLIEGYESSGIGGFWFSDLNQMIERYSYNSVGLRPWLGADPRFGKTTGVGDLVDAAGPSIGTIADVISAFADPEKSATNKAQAIRRAVPYNNVLWWGFMARDMATAAGKAAQ